MRKNANKKLALRSETLRALSVADLAGVAGGVYEEPDNPCACRRTTVCRGDKG